MVLSLLVVSAASVTLELPLPLPFAPLMVSRHSSSVAHGGHDQ